MQLLRMKQVTQRIGLCDARVYQMIGDGTFPKPIKLGDRAIAFLESEVNEWISKKAQAPRVEIAKPRKKTGVAALFSNPPKRRRT
jgi:prophage regulatory protein